MSDLEFLQERVPGYADYADPEHRHQVDQQMRALLGEALADARIRLKPSGPIADQLERLILRCEFSDQHVIHAADTGRFDAPLVDRIHALDRELVEIVDRVRAVTGVADLSPVLRDASRTLDERFGAIEDAPSRDGR